MRRENYKRLGEYIFPYLEKNVGLKVTLSQGINNNKYFQTPRQVAVDSENDQIVRTGQFAYNKATTRNGEKISIAYREGPDCTVSSAYQVFYIKDEEKLNPHYLLMWFKRPEFDRYARFKSFGSAHEFFTWEEMCNVYLPIPSIEEQRKIVAEYQAVEQRIENNNRLIKALEDTAQAIYHHTFVENIDPENLPEGWNEKGLDEVAKFKVGGDCPDVFSEAETSICNIPIYSNGEYMEGLYGYTNKAAVVEDSFTISARGNVGTCFLRRHPYRGIVRLVSVIPLKSKMLYYLYFNISARNLQGDGSAQSQITVPQLSAEKIIVPKQTLLEDFYEKCEIIYNNIESIKKEQMILIKVKSLLLSKLS